MSRFIRLLILAFTFFIAACDAPQPEVVAEPDQPASRQAETAEPRPVQAGIEWYDGGVDDAFALAKAENRPLFLYWGAVWCPPCVEIRNTVFKSQRFIAMSRLFVPVYLDGDTERAQDWGDRFGTKVYPTMIVFNPQGEEVTRLNAGIDISAYNDVLQTSLERMQPIADLAQAAIADPGALSESDYQQLAYYSWYDDKALPENTPPDLFLKLSDAAGKTSPGAAARLYLQYAVVAGQGEGTADPDRVTNILSTPERLFSSWDYLISPEQILPGLNGTADQLQALRTLWAETMRHYRNDERLTVKNRLYGWRPYLVFHFEGDEEKSRPLPADVIEAIRADGAQATAGLAGMHTRQSVINALANVYVLAGMSDDARALLQEEIGQSKTPYYFMGSLASLEQRQGNIPAALDWWEKAYDAAEGPATRIRWWARYITALTRLAPEVQDKILAAAMYPFDPAQGMDALFSGANFRNLERASRDLLQWEEQQADPAVLDPFRAEIETRCSLFEEHSSQHDRCNSLLKLEM